MDPIRIDFDLTQIIFELINDNEFLSSLQYCLAFLIQQYLDKGIASHLCITCRNHLTQKWPFLLDVILQLSTQHSQCANCHRYSGQTYLINKITESQFIQYLGAKENNLHSLQHLIFFNNTRYHHEFNDSLPSYNGGFHFSQLPLYCDFHLYYPYMGRCSAALPGVTPLSSPISINTIVLKRKSYRLKRVIYNYQRTLRPHHATTAFCKVRSWHYGVGCNRNLSFVCLINNWKSHYPLTSSYVDLRPLTRRFNSFLSYARFNPTSQSEWPQYFMGHFFLNRDATTNSKIITCVFSSHDKPPHALSF
jgi:hypothetical protein